MTVVATATPRGSPGPDVAELVICLLGPFHIQRDGLTLAMGESPKLQALLVTLAVSPGYRAGRETILTALWPARERELSSQALNSLTSSLRRALAGSLNGAAPVVYEGGFYSLNVQAGLSLDVAMFNELARAGNQAARLGDASSAVSSYTQAIELYRGDLCVGADINSVLERERLHALNLTLLARVADYQFGVSDYATALETALRLLSHDPCREDAHRLVIRCYVRLGERAQGMRQYRLCELILRQEFEAPPESATQVLFDQIRLDPASV